MVALRVWYLSGSVVDTALRATFKRARYHSWFRRTYHHAENIEPAITIVVGLILNSATPRYYTPVVRI